MSKIYFKHLLRRYLKGNGSPIENKTVEQWFQLLDDDSKDVFKKYNESDLEKELWNKIQAKTGIERKVQPLQVKSRNWMVWAAAASILILLSIGLLLRKASIFNDAISINAVSDNLLQQSNNTTKPQTIGLSDGSTVLLQPNSSIEYAKNFNGTKREVFLKGEAFFKVARNPAKPFLVYTNDLITKVLGTSFWVKSADNNKVEVSVITGKVSVFKRDAKEDNISEKTKSGVILTPNQSVMYLADNHTFTTRLVENPVLIQSEQEETLKTDFIFDETPIAEVFQQLENAYGIEIILANERIKTCPFTANLVNKPLYTQLDLLCASMHLNYEIRGTKILISGEGCE